MTTTAEVVPTVSEPETNLHIHLPPEAIVRSIGHLASDARPDIRRALAGQAQAVHETALVHSVETGRTVDIPSAAVWPGIVGQETVATMALSRRQNGRGLMQHPTDSTRHLIVPL